MAYPLPVRVESIQQPLAFPVNAEALMTYPDDTAESAGVDGYYNLHTAVAETYPTGYIYTENVATVEVPTADGCGVETINVGMPGWTLVNGLSTLTFNWLDVAAFFWFETPGELVDDFTPPPVASDPSPDIGQPCPPPELSLCIDPVLQVITPSLSAGECPPGSTVWADSSSWDSGLVCWTE